MNGAADLMSQNLEAAHRVGERLLQARRRLAGVLPLGPESVVDQFNDETVAWIDAFLKRWENFQDMLEGQIVRGVVILEGESDRTKTRRDRANFLEKLRLVDSADGWFEAGELRNRLAHSYPLAHPKQIQRINAATEGCSLLVETFNRIRRHVQNKNLAAVTVDALPSTDGTEG